MRPASCYQRQTVSHIVLKSAEEPKKKSGKVDVWNEMEKNMWNKARKGDVINVIQFGLTLQIISFHPSSLAPLLHFCSFMILIATWVLLSFSALSFCFWSQFSSINNKYELTCAYIHSVSVLHWPSKAHKIKKLVLRCHSEHTQVPGEFHYSQSNYYYGNLIFYFLLVQTKLFCVTFGSA